MSQLVTQSETPQQGADSSTETGIVSTGAETVQLLTFFLAGEMFSLRIAPIKEIIEYGKLTVIPLVPSFVRGVINIRGQVVPVIDLPVRFGWESSPLTKRSCIIIIEIQHDEESLELGVVIDSVNEVLELPSAALGAPPSFGAKIRNDFIEAMAKLDDEFIVVLDPAKVLSVDELSVLPGVADSQNISNL